MNAKRLRDSARATRAWWDSGRSGFADSLRPDELDAVANRLDELESKLQGCEKLLAEIMKAGSLNEQRDIIARHKGLQP